MDYKIEKKPAMTLVGYKRRFTGTPAQRTDQEADFYGFTRTNQYILWGLSHDCDTTYNIMQNFDDEGYDFYIAARPSDWNVQHLEEELEEDAQRFEKIFVPEGLYLVCETERSEYSTEQIESLRRRVVREWLPTSGYELAEAPEISVYRWFYQSGNEQLNHSRYAELWIPINCPM